MAEGIGLVPPRKGKRSSLVTCCKSPGKHESTWICSAGVLVFGTHSVVVSVHMQLRLKTVQHLIVLSPLRPLVAPQSLQLAQ